MDQFLVLTTFTDHMLADSVCGTLEEAGIAVLLEHIEIMQGSGSASGIRVLVPATSAERAMQIVRQSLRYQNQRSQAQAVNH